MSLRHSKFLERFAAFAFVLGLQRHANAQACCAGAGTVTPGRLAVHEAALVGLQLKTAAELGSFDAQARYAGSPPGASELDLEQDLFAAVRVLNRAQVALLVPLVETRRTSQGLSEIGGGLGDINLNLRYDFTLAGASPVVPGIAALAGVTFPSGKPPDAPDLRPLATDATGIGAFQANFGVAFEQAFGPWLLNATGIVAARSARSVTSSGITVHERLASQWTALGSLGYVLPSGAAVALSASYAVEGNATINGETTPDSGHRLTTVTASGLLPLSDTWRLQSSLFLDPPLSHLGLNQPALGGLLFTVVRSWT
jgi:hypothetical protein